MRSSNVFRRGNTNVALSEFGGQTTGTGMAKNIAQHDKINSTVLNAIISTNRICVSSPCAWWHFFVK